MIDYLGSYTVGGLFPTMVSLLGGVIAQLRGQLTGALRLSGMLAIKLPTIDARISAVARMAAQLQAAASGEIGAPSVTFNPTANVQVIAVLQAQLAVIAELQAAFGEAGVDVYRFSGTAAAMSAEVGAALGGGLPSGNPSEHVDAYILATRYPSTFDAMGKVFVAT